MLIKIKMVFGKRTLDHIQEETEKDNEDFIDPVDDDQSKDANASASETQHHKDENDSKPLL